MATVLVIDDDDIMRRLVRRRLAGTTHEVVGEASDGETGLTAWRDLEPQVVLLDEKMPRATGLEVAAVMLKERSAQRIVLFTAVPDQRLFREAEAIGIAACIAKTEVAALPGIISIVTGEPSL